MRSYNLLLFILLLSLLASCKKENASIYISLKGDNANIGSKSKPVADLETALLRVRALRKENRIEDTVFIWLEEGEYALDKTVVINELDSIGSGYPLIISALPDARVSINGAKNIDVAKIQPLSEVEKMLFPKEVGEFIKKIDLRNERINDYGKLHPVGFFRPNMALEMELFVNSRAGKLARWPNDSIVTQWKTIREGGKSIYGDTSGITGIMHYPTERITSWAKAKDAWLHGTFGTGYADDVLPVKYIDTLAQTIELGEPHTFGLNSDVPWHWWYIFNLPQELDQEGEYYIDRKQGIVYFYPPATRVESIALSVMENPLLAIENTSHVHIRNITFEATRGMAIYMEGGHHNTIENCTIRNVGDVGISIGRGVPPTSRKELNWSGQTKSRMLGNLHSSIYDSTTFNRNAGHHHSIISCEIYDTGQGGISLGGGNKVTLEAGNNWVHNNNIYRYNRRAQSLKVAIDLYGVGNKLSNNEIHEGYGMGIYMHGNEHVIEYNEIYDVLNDVQDFGAIYYGRDPSDQGNIIRYNYIHDVGGPWGYCRGIYLDDGTSGGWVYGNIIANMRNEINHSYAFNESQAILLNGGSYNTVENNLIINTPVGVQISSIILSRPQYIAAGGLYDQRLKRVNYQQPPYSEKYPKLVNFFKENPDVPKGNVIRNNVFLEVPLMFEAEKGWEKWLKRKSETERKAYEPLKPDWSGVPLQNFISENTSEYLLDSSRAIPQINYEAIQNKLPDFKRIPIEKIGKF